MGYRVLILIISSVTVLVGGLALTSCSSNNADSDRNKSDQSDKRDTPRLTPRSELSIGQTPLSAENMRKDRRTAPDRSANRPSTRSAAEGGLGAATETPPKLLPDGSIDDPDDHFSGANLTSVQPIPIDGDPSSTETIAAFSTAVHRVEEDAWKKWRADKSPLATDEVPQPVSASLVRVGTLRCGGARTVASGVIVGSQLVATTVHAIESSAARVRVSMLLGKDERWLAAQVRYLDVDDDIAILHVPGLKAQAALLINGRGHQPARGFVLGTGTGGKAGDYQRIPAVFSYKTFSATIDQRDGYARKITDRTVIPTLGGLSAGSSGAVLAATNDSTFRTGWGVAGIIRARVVGHQEGAGVAVPVPIIREAITAAKRLPKWFEHHPGGCPQWRR